MPNEFQTPDPEELKRLLNKIDILRNADHIVLPKFKDPTLLRIHMQHALGNSVSDRTLQRFSDMPYKAQLALMRQAEAFRVASPPEKRNSAWGRLYYDPDPPAQNPGGFKGQRFPNPFLATNKPAGVPKSTYPPQSTTPLALPAPRHNTSPQPPTPNEQNTKWLNDWLKRLAKTSPPPTTTPPQSVPQGRPPSPLFSDYLQESRLQSIREGYPPEFMRRGDLDPRGVVYPLASDTATKNAYQYGVPFKDQHQYLDRLPASDPYGGRPVPGFRPLPRYPTQKLSPQQMPPLPTDPGQLQQFVSALRYNSAYRAQMIQQFGQGVMKVLPVADMLLNSQYHMEQARTRGPQLIQDTKQFADMVWRDAKTQLNPFYYPVQDVVVPQDDRRTGAWRTR